MAQRIEDCLVIMFAMAFVLIVIEYRRQRKARSSTKEAVATVACDLGSKDHLEVGPIFHIDGVLVRGENGSCQKFLYPIQKAVKVDDDLVVCLEVPPKVIYNENVFRLTPDTAIRWQIAMRAYAKSNAPYAGIRFKKELLECFGWDSITVEVDPATGQIVSERFDR